MERRLFERRGPLPKGHESREKNQCNQESDRDSRNRTARFWITGYQGGSEMRTHRRAFSHPLN